MSVTNCIPRLLSSGPIITPGNNDFEDRNEAVLALLHEITMAQKYGDLRTSVCLFCPKCECYIEQSTRMPQPVHHCGTVLELATCTCCQKPATHWRSIEDRSINFYAIEPWAEGHSHKAVRP
jgi:hypothetical protein